jgi:hypothetical protein
MEKLTIYKATGHLGNQPSTCKDGSCQDTEETLLPTGFSQNEEPENTNDNPDDVEVLLPNFK